MADTPPETWLQLLTGAPLTALLPVVRTVRAEGFYSANSARQVFAIHADRIIAFRVRRRDAIPAEAYEPEKADALLNVRAVGPRAVIPLDQARQAWVAGPLVYGQRGLSGIERGYQVRVQTADDAWLELRIPEDEGQAVIVALRALLGERFTECATLPPLPRDARRLVAAPRWPALRLLKWIASISLLVMAAGIVLGKGDPGPWVGIPSSLGLLVSFVLGPLIAVSAWRNRPVAYGRKQRAERERARRDRQGEGDLSHRQPLRSLAWGRTLKALGALAFLVGFVVVLLIPQYMPIQHLNGILQAACYIPATILIYYGYRLSLRSADDVRHDDPRPPILYLRSFALDARNNFNPSGFVSQVLGLEPAALLRWLGPLGNVYPVRLMRLFFSSASDHAEEQLAGFLRRFGPFVAIGRPGDKLALGGAARLYVGDEEWRTVVQGLIREAQIVILQPDESEHMWWEIRETLRLGSPANVLYVLLSCAGEQWSYERFRLRLEPDLGCSLPRALGDAAFLYVDSTGPRLLPLRRHPHIAWPVVGCSVDFQRTLAPFLAARSGGQASIAPAPGWRTRWIGAPAAMAFWIGILSAIYLAAGGVAGDSRMRTEALAMAEAAKAGVGARIEKGPGGTPYEITLSSGWQPQKVEVPLLQRLWGADQYFRAWTYRDFALCFVQVEPASSGGVADSRAFRDRVVQELGRQKRSVEVLGETTEMHDGREWLSTRLRSKGTGLFVTEEGLSKGALFVRHGEMLITLRTYVGPHGFIQIRTEAARSAAEILDPVLEQVFRSFHYHSPAQQAAAARRAEAQETLMAIKADASRKTYSVGPLQHRVPLSRAWTELLPGQFKLGDIAELALFDLDTAALAPAERASSHAAHQALQKNFTPVHNHREIDIVKDGRTWTEAQFDGTYDGVEKTVFEWLTVGLDGAVGFRALVRREEVDDFAPIVRDAFAGLRVFALAEEEMKLARLLDPGRPQSRLTGRALAYTLTVGENWQTGTNVAPFDLYCELRERAALGVVLEDLGNATALLTARKYTDAVLDNLRTASGGTIVIDKRETFEHLGLPWERVRYRVPNGGALVQYTAHLTIHGRIGVQVLGWSNFGTPQAHDFLIDPVFRSFKLPP